MFPPLSPIKGEKATDKVVEGAEVETNDFDLGSEPKLDIICNMIYVFPLKYDIVTEVIEEEAINEELATHKPLCYYVMNDGSVNEDRAILERPYIAMQHNLKPLYIRAKVNGVGMNKVLIDCGVCVNVIPQFLLRKIGKSTTNLSCNNMVLFNYKGRPTNL